MSLSYRISIAVVLSPLVLTLAISADAGIIWPDRSEPPTASANSPDCGHDPSASPTAPTDLAVNMTSPIGTLRSIDAIATARLETLPDRWVGSSFQPSWSGSETQAAASAWAISLPTMGISSHMATLAERFIRPVNQSLLLETRHR